MNEWINQSIYKQTQIFKNLMKFWKNAVILLSCEKMECVSRENEKELLTDTFLTKKNVRGGGGNCHVQGVTYWHFSCKKNVRDKGENCHLEVAFQNKTD